MSLRQLRNSKSRLSFDADDLFAAIGSLSEIATRLVRRGSFVSANPSPQQSPSTLPELSSSRLRRPRDRGDNNSFKNKASTEVDYHAEGEKVFLTSKLHLSSSDNRQKNIHLDPIFKAANDKSVIYCGDYHAASDISLLKKLNITYIVNCTRPCPSGELPNYHEGTAGYKYFNFPIAIWQLCVATPGNKRGKYGESLPDVGYWFGLLVAFIDEAIANGACILIHCLAGAHRAGSTSIAMLMNYANLDYEQALAAAKICRPVIDPIGNLPTLLALYDKQRPRPKDAIERNVRMVGNLAIRTMSQTAGAPSPYNDSSSKYSNRASFSTKEDLRTNPSLGRINESSGRASHSHSASFNQLPHSLTKRKGDGGGVSQLSATTVAASPLALDLKKKIPGTSAGYSGKKIKRRYSFTT